MPKSRGHLILTPQFKFYEINASPLNLLPQSAVVMPLLGWIVVSPVAAETKLN